MIHLLAFQTWIKGGEPILSRRYIDIQKNMHLIKLQQLGANVEVIEGVMHFIRFEVEDTTIKYVYHINDKGFYFLQRRAPYPLNFGTYSSQDNVIQVIQDDIAQMRNAKRSKKFEEFIAINQAITSTASDFENLFLYYNVPGTEARKIEKKMAEFRELLQETKKISKRINFDDTSFFEKPSSEIKDSKHDNIK